MNFLLTKYIYPLREPLVLSKHLGIYLDNPRTDDEMTVVAWYLRDALRGAYQWDDQRLPPVLDDLRRSYADGDEYIKEFWHLQGGEDPIELLARMWVVARFDDEGRHEALRRARSGPRKPDEFDVDSLWPDDPIYTKPQQLTEYGHLLSLLVCSDCELYDGRSFLLDYRWDWYKRPGASRHAWFHVHDHATWREPEGPPSEAGSDWLRFPVARDDLLAVGQLLDAAFERGLKDKLLYIAGLLQVAGHEIGDDRAKLVTLVSIIELLVTHSPDFSRYNVEDSINKQFQLKAATLVYLHNKTQDLPDIKARLRQIYERRSAIAHGNFNAVEKHVEKAKKAKKAKKTGEDYSISALVTEVYCYLRAIITEYLRDDKFVDFLKDG